MIEAFQEITPVDPLVGGQVGAVKITITPGGGIQVSNYGTSSFTVENIGDKRIAALYFDVADALFPDTVFDPVGLAGDSVSRGLTFGSTGGTGVFQPGSGNVLVPFYGAGGVNGYEGMLLTFDTNIDGGYNPGELIKFGVDMDPNSIVGLPQQPIDSNENDPRLNSWDIGGVSGAELINAKVHVLFTDGTTAVGELMGDSSQGGSVAIASQASPNKQVTLSVNGIEAGGAGFYTHFSTQVLVLGPAGDTARVVMAKGFIQPFDYIEPNGNPINLSEKFIGAPFPANNALQLQTVDVLLDGTVQDITSLFNFDAPGGSLAFASDDELPIGFVASIIDENQLPIGPVTQPIYLIHDAQPTSDIRINAGGDSYTDTLNNQWLGDQYVTGGQIYTKNNPIANTPDDPIYQSERYGNFSYAIPVANGSYDLNLLFAEIYFNEIGKRIFDVTVEGQLLADDLDLFAQWGSNTAYKLPLNNISVTDGELNITFISEVNNAKLSGIEVLKGSSGPVNDTISPTGTIVAPHVTNNEEGEVTYNFTVEYNDNTAIDTTTLDNTDVIVTGPNGYNAAATLVTSTTNNGVVTATYQITPPGGSWNGADDGIYTVTLQAGSVKDTSNNGVGEVQKTFTVAVSTPQPTSVIRLNAGGDSFTDTLNNQWLGDQYFTGGQTYTTNNPIGGTKNDLLYQSERYGNFSYAIPVANSIYDLNLLFAEIYFNNFGKRVFDVTVEGQLEKDNLDLVSLVEPNTAYQLPLNDVEVNDGELNITFKSEVDNAKLSGIEVFGTGNTPPPPPPQPSDVIRINAGAGEYTDALGQVWVTDQFFVNGKTFNTGAEIFKTDDDTLYQSHRYAKNLLYNIPINNGNYTVNLHFAETYFTDFEKRVFDVFLENEQVFDDLDILAKSKNAFFPGKDSALVLSFPDINIADGILDLDLLASINNGLLSAIEIVPQSGPQVIVKQTKGDTKVVEGENSDSYSIVLNTAPTADVTIQLQFDQQRLITDKPSVTFTSENWNIPQVITVSAVNDNIEEGTETNSIIHTVNSFDSAYDNRIVPDVNVTIIDNDAVPISFTQKTVASIANPTRGAWGSDGRLYVGTYDGQINAYTFDGVYNVIDVQTIGTLANASNPNILGIAFNPFSTSEAPEIYVAHSELYANGGGSFPQTELSPYSGQISVLTGPDFSTLTPLITGLPVSNHDHGVNGIEFDGQGDLLVSLGGNTNAGIPNDKIGGIPESPFSAAILKAEITKPNFNGAVEYVLPTDFTPPDGLTFEPSDSQVFGNIANVAPGVDVSLYAYGLRNSFDLLWTTKGLLYATDNGANQGFGDVSTSATTQEPFTANVPDELNLITENAYYGHPNPNQGRYDERLNVWYSPFEDSIPGVYTAPLATMQASTNGLDEYRATTFNNQLLGNLLAQKWNGSLYSFELSPNGQSVVQQETFTGIADGLDLLTGPGGAIVGVDLTQNSITVALPNDVSVSGTKAFDIFPWRAPAIGGQEFVIGGVGFGDITNTTVTIGGQVATLSSVSETRINGVFPDLSSQPDQLLDIVLQSGGQISTIEDAFQPLFDV